MTVERHTWASLLRAFDGAGTDLTQLAAAEAAAGNISVFVRKLEGVQKALPAKTEFSLPVRAPALAGGWVVVTGTGRRLRDLEREARKNVCALKIQRDGVSAVLHAEGNLRPTSELNSHLAVHSDQVSMHGYAFHAVVHAQPRFLTYLSHHPGYQDSSELNRRLMRWEPETSLAFPEGIETISFEVPGTEQMMLATVRALRDHRMVIWQRHGAVTRSDQSIQAASDLIEYAETAAHFEYLNLQLGEPSHGMSPSEMRDLRQAWGLLPDSQDP